MDNDWTKTIAGLRKKNDEMAILLKCALADLEGIMPDYERSHPGWTTIEEIRAFLNFGDNT